MTDVIKDSSVKSACLLFKAFSTLLNTSRSYQLRNFDKRLF